MTDSGFTQADRILNVDTGLGADQLLAERLMMREAISELFEIQLQVRSKKDDLKADVLVGHVIDVSLKLENDERRYWNGLVTSISAKAKIARDLQVYQLTLKPQLWLMTQKSDCRIWMDKTSVEICQVLFSEYGLPQPNTTGIFHEVPKQHYSVQYNETDFDYLSRRLEQDGIFYWFEHTQGQHIIRLGNNQSAYTPGSDIPFSAGESHHDHISSFEKSFSYLPGHTSGGDWNFEKPDKTIGAETRSLINLPHNSEYELFKYPTVPGYGSGNSASQGLENDAVERDARIRMQAMEAEHQRFEGESIVRVLAPGARFTPVDISKNENQFGTCAVVAIEHSVIDTSYDTGFQPDNHMDKSKKIRRPYTNRFHAIPESVPAIPQRNITRPRIDGTQVAVVAGPEGEEIYPDEYGRVKVWFPWDRRAQKNGADTCWIRVMQNWAGAGWGTQVVPRISMEVLISYFEGDPDRPAIIGAVSNSKQKVPYPLPQHKTRSTFKTNTHKGSGSNEMRFEDRAGGEEVFFHAEKDFHIGIRDNQNTHVGGYKHSQINKNETKHVLGTQHQHSNFSTTMTAGKDFVITAGQKSRFRGTKSRDFHKSSRYYVNYQDITDSSGTGGDGRNGSVYISSQYDTSLNVGESLNINSGKNASVVAREGVSISSEQNVRISAVHDVIQSSDEKFIISAEDVMVLKCGKAHIAMKSNGDIELVGNIITAQGKKILLN